MTEAIKAVTSERDWSEITDCIEAVRVADPELVAAVEAVRAVVPMHSVGLDYFTRQGKVEEPQPAIEATALEVNVNLEPWSPRSLPKLDLIKIGVRERKHYQDGKLGDTTAALYFSRQGKARGEFILVSLFGSPDSGSIVRPKLARVLGHRHDLVRGSILDVAQRMVEQGQSTETGE